MATSDIPVPRSFNEIMGQMLDAFLSRFGITSLKVGGPIISFLEASAQSQLRSSKDIFQLLESQSLDNSKGIALDQIGLSEDLPRRTEGPASGTVNVGDSSFVKINTKLYQPAPIIGSGSVNVSDATNFPASGNIYIGRGTTNFEGPLAYISKINNGTYWTLTLSSGTLRFHNIGDSVILAQGGNRLVSATNIVQTPQGNASNAVSFRVLYPVTVPDGETSLTGVQVIAQSSGIIGNVVAHAINQFSAPPFAGATVDNPLPFTNGQATEVDDDYRNRIRNARNSRSKGTRLAITTSVNGITSPDENKRVISSSVVSNQGREAVLYIDDGTGYEERSEGVAIESLSDSALGGEQFFRVSFPGPITKAAITSTVTAPFNLSNGAKLAFLVGGVETEHTFNDTDFEVISNATGFEVVSSINSNANLLWGARTAESGNKIIAYAKTDSNEDIQNVAASGIDANDEFGFPSSRVDTMRLYKNDILLNKDGKTASIKSNAFNFWEVLSGNQTLEISVDGIPLNFDGISLAAFTDQDFIDGDTGFTTVGKNSLNAWITVFNNRIPGITATIVASSIVITSNRDTSSRSQLEITGGTLVTNGVFEVALSVGAEKDYTLDRNTGELELRVPLSVGDTLSAGSISTRAFLESSTIGATNISPDANLWFSVDGKAEIIQTGLTSSTKLNIFPFEVNRWGNKLRIESNTGSSLFGSVQSGDFAVFWDPALTDLHGAYRISDTDSDTYIDIEKKALNSQRGGHTITKLSDNRILVTGGYSAPNKTSVINSGEIYDPATQKWTSTANMNTQRVFHTATLIAGGKVLIVGGTTTSSTDDSLLSAEIYDPVADTWTITDPLPAGARSHHTANILVSGKVLVVGGKNTIYLNSTYLYDPSAIPGSKWTSAGILSVARAFHASTSLPDGDVLVAGGQNGILLSSAERYDTAGPSWGAASSFVGAARQSLAMVLRGDGKAMAVGGATTLDGVSPTNSGNVDTYDPGLNTWAADTALGNPSSYHTLVKITDNSIISAFGYRNSQSNKFEIYNAGVWTAGSVQPVGFGTNKPYRASLGAIELSAPFTNQVLYVGGIDASTAFSVSEPIASSVIYNKTGVDWLEPDASNALNLALSSNGITIVRSNALLQNVVIPTGTNYTAPTFVDEINSQISGAKAQVFRTTKIRINTNTFNDVENEPLNIIEGDISLAANDVEGAKLNIESENATTNVSGHLASIESSVSELDVPDFQQLAVRGSDGNDMVIVQWSTLSSTNLPDVSSILTITKDYYDSSVSDDDARYGTNAGFRSAIKSLTNNGSTVLLSLRKSVETSWTPTETGYLAAPYAIYPNDEIVIVADQDTVTKRFAIKMSRKLKTVGSVYALQNTFLDADNSNASIAQAFGVDYNFDDFAIYMSSRVKTHQQGDSTHYTVPPINPTRTILWRYYKLGPDGNKARVHYSLPSEPDADVEVDTDNTTDLYTDISIKLSSGAQKTIPSLVASNGIGVACTANSNGLASVVYVLGYPIASATRVANVTTLTLTLTGGVTDHGLAISDQVYVNSTNVNFTTSAYTLTGRSPTTVSYTETAPNFGPAANIGTISKGPSEATLLGASPAVVVGDFFRMEASSGILPQYENKTLRISPLSNNQTIQGKLEDDPTAPTISVNTVVTWGDLTTLESFKIFANSSDTAATINSAVNALAAVTNSIVPIKGTLIGNGSGIINQSSAEEAGYSPVWFNLTDGVNYVKTTVNPLLVINNYDLVFKLAIDSNLTTDSDWANEEVRIVPITNENLVEWFNTPTISGLSSACATEVSSRASKLQISSLTPGSNGSVQVQGGTANSAAATVFGSSLSANGGAQLVSTVTKSSAGNLFSGMWVDINNSVSLPKSSIVSTTKLYSINTAGEFLFDSSGTKVWDNVNTPTLNAVIQIEKQGRFIIIKDTGLGTAITLSSIKEGDYVKVSASPLPLLSSFQIASVNTGVFKVIRVSTPGIDGKPGVFWIENENASESRISECDIEFITFNSVVPNDKLQISTDTWDVDNKGTWEVQTVGKEDNTVSVGGLARTLGTTVTVTTDVPHTFSPGHRFMLSPGETDFVSGTKVIATVIGPNQFTYTEAGANTASTLIQVIEGFEFQNFYRFKVDITNKATTQFIPNPIVALGANDANLIKIVEGILGRFIKQILSVSPNQIDGVYADIKFTTGDNVSRISNAAGSIVTDLNKLEFSTSLAKGLDGYGHSIGIIGEANKVLYGDPSDTVTYPGVVSIGSRVNISGPIVKAIELELLLRVRSGVVASQIKESVKSTVAALVNNTGVGESISLSDIVTAAGSVNGVVAVTILFPLYSGDSNLIPVQPQEKPLVLSLNDIKISFVGE